MLGNKHRVFDDLFVKRNGGFNAASAYSRRARCMSLTVLGQELP
ncbi:MAG: hypothetical protein R2874_07865 [Desulfobacterales bacterium]